ncbi:MAG: hypothetical protein WDN76_02290 [Alphaproteobacteria bacterium]
MRGLHKDQLLFTIEEDWTVGGKTYSNGSLLSMKLDQTALPAPQIHLLYGPGPRESIEDVAVTKDAVLVASTRNVLGRLLRFAFDGRAWLETEIKLPGGTLSLASASPTSSTAFAVAGRSTDAADALRHRRADLCDEGDQSAACAVRRGGPQAATIRSDQHGRRENSLFRRRQA